MSKNVYGVVLEMELNDDNDCCLSDEALNHLIEFHEDIEDGEYNIDITGISSVFDKDADKENLVTNRFLSTKKQLEKLDASKAIEDFGDEADKDDKWNVLAKELNRIGPERSTEKWKKIWAARKYNLKKRAIRQQEQSRAYTSGRIFDGSGHAIDDQQTSEFRSNNTRDMHRIIGSSYNQPSNNDDVRATIPANTCCSETSKFLPLILEKLDVLSEEMRKNNDLLKKFLEK